MLGANKRTYSLRNQRIGTANCSFGKFGRFSSRRFKYGKRQFSADKRRPFSHVAPWWENSSKITPTTVCWFRLPGEHVHRRVRRAEGRTSVRGESGWILPYASSRRHAATPNAHEHGTAINFCTYIYTHNMRHTRCTDISIRYGWCWFVEWRRAKWIEQSSGVRHIDET